MAGGNSAVSGVLYVYAATAVNYALALLYVALLTRCVPIDQYGYYNALIAIVGLVGMFFPTLGLDMAVTREGAAVALTPLYVSRGVPPDVLPAACIYAAYIVLGGASSALSLPLDGRKGSRHSQGRAHKVAVV
jgi:hypothetical protein